MFFAILALLPLAQSPTPSPAPRLVDALADTRMAEPAAVAQALTEEVRINPTSAEGGWLADLRGFDAPEREELSDLLRKEGVGLGDRSKLRRLVAASTSHVQSTATKVVVPRRVQQVSGREEMSATSAQLKNQQGDHAGTAQPSGEQADDGLGLSGDSALFHRFGIRSYAPRRAQGATSFSFRLATFVLQALMLCARRSNRDAGHSGPRGRRLHGASPLPRVTMGLRQIA